MNMSLIVVLYLLLCWVLLTFAIVVWPRRAAEIMEMLLHRPKRHFMKTRVQFLLLAFAIISLPAKLILKLRLLLWGYSPEDWK